MSTKSAQEKPFESALAAALVKAQEACGVIYKDSRNEFAKFDYVAADDMVAHARAALNDNGLAVTQENVELLPARTPGGEAGEVPWVRIEYSVSHTSGELRTYFVDRPVVEGKGRPMDKALDSAQTTALSYFLRGLLQIPRSDRSLEVEARDDSAYAPTEKKKAKPAAAKPAPALAPVEGDDYERMLRGARTLDELRTAWEVVKLGGGTEKYGALKDERKAELGRVA